MTISISFTIFIHTGIDTNSTLLRSLVTTEVHDHFLDGTIDERGRQAVDFANTHSSAMAADHYLMRDAQRQAVDALRVASIVSPQASSVQVSSPQRIMNGSLRSLPAPPRPAPQQQWRLLPWGTAHPLFPSDTNSRAMWSEAEVSLFIILLRPPPPPLSQSPSNLRPSP
jgi:hypothetical protein